MAFGIIFLLEFNMQDMSDPQYYASVVGFNLLTSLAGAWFALLGVAAYRMVQHQSADPVEVFE